MKSELEKANQWLKDNGFEDDEQSEGGSSKIIKSDNVITQPLDMISASELQKLEIPPQEFVVDGLVPHGLTALGAPPKSYKSFMCLDMAICACLGDSFMGFHTKQCDVLYLDLESTKRRPKERMKLILKGQEAPENLYIATQADPLGKGFEEQINEAVKEHPNIKLVIVDVFKKIRTAASKNKDPYERDYEDFGAVKGIADRLNIAILLVLHTTKMKHPDDPFNEIAGSAGVMGALDAALAIKKDARQDKTAKLYITGRDFEEQCYEIEFDNANSFKWKRLGTAEEVAQQRHEQAYRESPIVQTIKKLLEQNGGEWKGTVTDMINASRYFKGCTIYGDVRTVGRTLESFRDMMLMKDKIMSTYKKIV